MAVRERREKYILPMLDTLGMDESIVYYDDDRNDKMAMPNARRTWLAPTEATHVCVLQDDLELSNRFPEIVEKCADNFPSSIFSFFQSQLKEEDKGANTPYIQIRGCGMYGQAIMIPRKMIPVMFYWIDENYGVDYRHDDTAIGFFASMNDIPVMSTIPSIVQHLGHNDSTLGYNNKRKVSRVFMKDVDANEFDAKTYIMSRNISNFQVMPKNGFKYGSLKTLKELMER